MGVDDLPGRNYNGKGKRGSRPEAWEEEGEPKEKWSEMVQEGGN